MPTAKSTQAPENRLVAFPAKEEIALTPALWLACGVVSYNYALLARHPMRILASTEIPNLNDTRAEYLRRGFAVAIDAATLLPSVRSAMLQISRTLLAPLHFTVTLQGQAGKQHYFLIEFHGGLDLPIPDAEAETGVPLPRPVRARNSGNSRASRMIKRRGCPTLRGFRRVGFLTFRLP